MIERYEQEEVTNLWNEENKIKLWTEIEIAVVEALTKQNIVPVEDLNKIKSKIKINIDRMLELEKETKHDVVAFTRMLSESLGEEKKWIHFGLTSTDIVDTCQNILIKKSNDILFNQINILKDSLYKLAIDNKRVLITGRTHGMFGEPTSLGLKFLLWYEEIKRHIQRINLARTQIEVSKISGSMGNYANIDPEVEEYVADKFNLSVDLLSTQVTQRDRHANLVLCYANLASTYEKITTEIRLFQRSEVGEINEGFSSKQKGSSSMPHKKNPIGSENITGLSRMIRSYVNIALENNVLWHERDISHSSNERIYLSDMFHLLVFTTKRLNDILINLYINKDKISQNLDIQNKVFFSQRVLTHILANNQVSREEVYDFIQKCTFISINQNLDFKTVLIENNINKYLSDKELEDLFEINYFIRNVDKIYNRIK